jgi:hypothetical protein
MTTRHFMFTVGLLGLCVIALSILARGEDPSVPHSERRTLTGADAAAHEEIERVETIVPAGQRRDDQLVRAYLAVVDRELEHGHVDVAVRVWQDAYGAALESRTWESMIAVGDAFLAIGRVSGAVRGARHNAREAYLTGLIRARRERSVDGVLRAAEAFRRLDDRAVADHCLRIAGQLATGDESAERKVQEARRRWTDPTTSRAAEESAVAYP